MSFSFPESLFLAEVLLVFSFPTFNNVLLGDTYVDLKRKYKLYIENYVLFSRLSENFTSYVNL